jgi:hypothetical protein
MTVFAFQYLENNYPDATPIRIKEHLREAFGRVKFDIVLLGWKLPPKIEDIVAEETSKYKAWLFRWQPLFTFDSPNHYPSDFSTVNINGSRIPGFRKLPEFTFVCPNHPQLEELLYEQLDSISKRKIYQGIFLDRIRFPSPTQNPARYLGCFCTHCSHKAADQGLDLDIVRDFIRSSLIDGNSASNLAFSLFENTQDPHNPLDLFLEFRATSISLATRTISNYIHAEGLEVGLDCFTPSLSRMVGQDLASLSKMSDWIKIMTYPRVFGPAGYPFEILRLWRWLARYYSISDLDFSQWIRKQLGIQIPDTRLELASKGLPSSVFQQEFKKGREMGISNLYAGVAMTLEKGANKSTINQITSDLQYCRDASGIVVSWDLWKTPIHYLEIVQRQWSLS